MQKEVATFAGGCFWCTEAVFKRLKGISEVIPGYSGGKPENPLYEQVSTGATGHAEAIHLTFDPDIISYDKLLDIFFATHNPTTRNQQGGDIGTQYRSVIFYHSDEHRQKAAQKIQELEKAKKFSSPIITEVSPFSAFYKAENYHQNYYDNNPLKPYCQIVIDPKIRKLIEQYSSDVRVEYKA